MKKYKTKAQRRRGMAVPLLALTISSVVAQPLPPGAEPARTVADQNQLIEQQRQAQQREQAVNAPVVRGEHRANPGWPVLPAETPCFPITHFELDVPEVLPDAVRAQGAPALPTDHFHFAQKWLEHYRGQCIGRQGVVVLTKGLQQAILSRGFVTTRVMLAPQDIHAGTLKLSLVPGVINQLRFADPSLRGTWKSAFPTRAGDLLNLRDLEQGLEQMKRPVSQQADMQIVPTQSPGESDVVIGVKRSKPWTLIASVDNSGQRATGKLQGNLTLGVDNLAGLNDLFNVSFSHDLESDASKLGSRGFNGFYSVPLGYWTATLSGSSNNYHQQISGANQTFLSSGDSKMAALHMQRVLSRGQNDVLGGYAQLSKRYGSSFIDDTEIDLQHRDNTFMELGLTDRHYLGGAQLDGTLAYRRGIGGLGAAPDPLLPPDPHVAPTAAGKPLDPTYRYRMAVLDMNLSVPFTAGGAAFRYVTTLHGQYTRHALYYIDDLSIGSRYTVRGFDGEQMLAAERGFYWRNELQVPLGPGAQSLYTGIDYGHVYGPNARYLSGVQLAGAVVGLRNTVALKYVMLSYDVFAGAPLYSPSTFQTGAMTAGFQVMAQF